MKHVVYDCDNTLGVLFSDVDDGLALLYLMAQKDTVDLLGITTTYGNSREEKVYKATVNMLKDCGREDLPVVRGGNAPGVYDSAAADFLVEQANRYPGELSILATGSLTNLEGAYRKDLHFFEKVKEIVLMGGITAPLVFSKNTMDELNFSCDPKASFDVLSSGANVSTFTGNNCLSVLFTTEEYKRELYSAGTHIANFIRDRAHIYAGLNESIFGIEGFYNWDVFSAVYLCHPEYFRGVPGHYALTEEDLGRGFLREEDNGPYVLNLPEVKDPEAFKAHIYASWLSLDIPYRTPHTRLTWIGAQLAGRVLNRLAALWWNRGNMAVRFTGKGINGHGTES